MPELNEGEKKYLSCEDAHKYTRADTILSDKLLYCLLETMKEMKEEIQELRKTNERLESKIGSIITTNNYSKKPAVTVYNTNL